MLPEVWFISWDWLRLENRNIGNWCKLQLHVDYIGVKAPWTKTHTVHSVATIHFHPGVRRKEFFPPEKGRCSGFVGDSLVIFSDARRSTPIGSLLNRGKKQQQLQCYSSVKVIFRLNISMPPLKFNMELENHPWNRISTLEDVSSTSQKTQPAPPKKLRPPTFLEDPFKGSIWSTSTGREGLVSQKNTPKVGS